MYILQLKCLIPLFNELKTRSFMNYLRMLINKIIHENHNLHSYSIQF